MFELQSLTKTATKIEGREEPNDPSSNVKSMNGLTTNTGTSATTIPTTNFYIVHDTHIDDNDDDDDKEEKGEVDNLDLLFFNQGVWHLRLFKIKMYKVYENDQELIIRNIFINVF